MPNQPVFVFFASVVEGHSVTRYGPGSPHPQIGVSFVDGRMVWDTEAVFAFTQQEMDAYGALYMRHVRDGALKKREQKDFEAYQEAQRGRAKAVLAFPKEARETHAEVLSKHFGRKPEEITDVELLAWAERAGVGPFAPRKDA